jgi:hypothetical protein
LDLGGIWAKSYVQNGEHVEAMNKKKVTRREAIKTMAAAAAVLVAVPHLGKFGSSNQATSNQRTTNEIQPTAKFGSEDEPFVVLVGKNGVRGFKGFEEFTLNDSGLKQTILNAFNSAGLSEGR